VCVVQVCDYFPMSNERCAHCDRLLLPRTSNIGRPREYCDTACRDAAGRDRARRWTTLGQMVERRAREENR
jgi:hypothetical protein